MEDLNNIVPYRVQFKEEGRLFGPPRYGEEFYLNLFKELSQENSDLSESQSTDYKLMSMLEDELDWLNQVFSEMKTSLISEDYNSTINSFAGLLEFYNREILEINAIISEKGGEKKVFPLPPLPRFKSKLSRDEMIVLCSYLRELNVITTEGRTNLAITASRLSGYSVDKLRKEMSNEYDLRLKLKEAKSSTQLNGLEKLLHSILDKIKEDRL